MNKTEKRLEVSQISESLKGLQSLIITDYKGLTVSEITELRRKLHQNKASFRVVKNTLAELSFELSGLKDMIPYLKDSTALAYSSSDPVSCAKVLLEFKRSHENLKLRAGWLNGSSLTIQSIEDLAKLPSREVLLAQVAAGLMSPISGFARVLAGPLNKLVRVLDAIRQKKTVA